MKIRIPKRFVIMFVIGLFSVFILSCGDNNGGGGGDDDDVQSLTITGESGDQVALNGTWRSECIDLGGGESEKLVMTISGTTFSQTEDEWFDSITCAGESDASVMVSGDFVLGDELTATKDGGDVTATELDIVITSVEYIINNPAEVADFNTDEECGFDDWAVDTPKELLGTDCFLNADIKDILYIDDTVVPVALYMGDEDGPLDGNGYPIEIESDDALE